MNAEMMPPVLPRLAKAATGVPGLDEILLGGVPAGRPTLVCGSAGCGKTLLGMTFLVNGATRYDEPGVFVSFEETGKDLVENVASLGFDVQQMMAEKKLAIDHIKIDRSEIEESGDYDLEGLFVRLGYAVDQIGAKRVVLDTIETLFSTLSNQGILRAELRRLFGWLKYRGLTAVITAERGDGSLTRNSLEEYVSDCVILLDHRVLDQVTTRRLRVVKYRGSAHGTNEYPFLLDDQGITVLPLSSVGLRHRVYDEAIPTGVPALDAMLGVGGIYRGSSVLVSGVAGSGKTILGASFAAAAGARGERSLFLSFEESADQLVRNVGSAGIDLQTPMKTGLLHFNATRATVYGLETHLAVLQRELDRFQPTVAVVDPVSAFRGAPAEVHAFLLRLLDMLKTRGITTVFTSLMISNDRMDQSDFGMSSLMDTWIALIDIESSGERNRGLYILKSRGMNHSNQISEYVLTDHGIELMPPYLGAGGVLTGSARLALEAQEQADGRRRREEVERRRREIARKRMLTERQIAELQTEIEALEAESSALSTQEADSENIRVSDRAAMAVSRRSKWRAANGGDPPPEVTVRAR